MTTATERDTERDTGPHTDPDTGPHTGPGSRPGTQPQDASERESVWTVVFGFAFWGAVGVAWLLSDEQNRNFVRDHWLALSLTATAAVLLVLGLASQRRIRAGIQRHAAMRAGLVLAFGVLPAATLALMPAQQQVYTLRGLFLLVVVFTPSVMWWLFVVGQRESLLNEYLANLGRLGLLDHALDHALDHGPGRDREPEGIRQIRVSSYLQKFEANFVRIPVDVYESVVAGRPRPALRDESDPRTPLASSAVPVLLTLLLMTIGWLITLPPAGPTSTADEPLFWRVLAPSLTPVTAAFLGAYFFSLQMLFRRYVRRDLRGSAYVSVVMRVILAVVGTWVLTEILLGAGARDDDWRLVLLGFAVGVFPKVAWQIVQSLFAKAFRWTLPSMQAEPALSEIDGLTVWHEARLEEEDIENVPNMATADLVELMVSTRFPPDRIVDWVDQAILLTHLGPEEARPERRQRRRNGEEEPTLLSRLARHGIRNATDLLAAVEEAEGRGAGADLCRILGGSSGPQVVPALLASMGTSCNLGRIRTWRRMDGV
jgi:hypothetical protein